MIEAIRFELTCPENHRGRKPCEWRIDNFVIPKAIICTGCKDDKATTKDSFVSLCNRSGLDPQELVDTYLCRSCRGSIKKDSIVTMEEPDNHEEDTSPKRINARIHGHRRLGFIVKGKPVRFCILSEDSEKFIPIHCIGQADEVHDLTLRICIKHCDIDGCYNGGKFTNAPMYNAQDMIRVINRMMAE